MKKKIISLCVVVVLLAIMVVGGTLAYFTDTDAEVNTMTTGNVKIDQEEWEGEDEDEDGIPDDPWEDDEDILPDVPIDKFVTVTNTGSQDAYLRTLFAFEDTWDIRLGVHAYYQAENDADIAAQLHLPYDADSNQYLQFIATVTDADNNVVDQAIYTVSYWDYKGELFEPDDVFVSLKSVKLDAKMGTNQWTEYANYGKEVEQDDGTMKMEYTDEKYNIVVLSQATQAASFDSAEEALNAAFGEITVANADEVIGWFESAMQAELPEGQTVSCEYFDYNTYAEDAVVCGKGAPVDCSWTTFPWDN